MASAAPTRRTQQPRTVQRLRSERSKKLTPFPEELFDASSSFDRGAER